jgi:hypothetical protein
VSNDFVKRHLFSISKLITDWFGARPLVLGAARVRDNWFLHPTKHGAILTRQGSGCPQASFAGFGRLES